MGKKTEKTDHSKNRAAIVGPNLSFSAAEAYKLLRTNVMFSLPENDGGRIFGVTSSVQGEGKSTTAANLAYTIAESGKKVLLIEMDMRLPAVHKMITSIQKTPGLSNLLVGNAQVSEAVQRSGIHDHLFVLTAGNLPPNPSELLGSERMRMLMKAFQNSFDYIICDLPPVTVVADALTISPLMDGMIVTVRRGYTDRRALDATVRQLKFSQVKILGFVTTFGESMSSYKKRYKKYGQEYGYYYAAAEQQLKREQEPEYSAETMYSDEYDNSEEADLND